jgi:hypothetical protein
MNGPYRVLSSLAHIVANSKGFTVLQSHKPIKNGFLTHEDNNNSNIFSFVNESRCLKNITLFLIPSKCSYFDQCNVCKRITVIIDLRDFLYIFLVG